MVIQVLFALQTMTTNGHAMVSGVDDIGILNLAQGLEFLESATNLDIDIFTAGKLPADSLRIVLSSRRFQTPLTPTSSRTVVWP